MSRGQEREKLCEKNISYRGGKYSQYEISQMQRKQERAVRAAKRQYLAEDAAGCDIVEAAAKLKQKRTRLADFLRETGQRKDGARESVSGFGHSAASRAVWNVRKNTLTNAAGQSIMKVQRTLTQGTPNSITQKQGSKGGIDRNYYRLDGKQLKQITDNDHGNPKKHPYGKKGEHVHDYVWDGDTLIDRPMRELTDDERKENSDIL